MLGPAPAILDCHLAMISTLLNFNIAGEISRSASGQVIYVTGEVQYMTYRVAPFTSNW